MLTKTRMRQGKADRACARSARAFHNRPINISIRANTGERQTANQKRSIFAIDKFPRRHNCNAIDWSVVSMDTLKALIVIGRHLKRCEHSDQWYAGVRIASRRHPWDEQESSFPSKAWIDIPAETPEEAQKVLLKLFEIGCAKSPIQPNSPQARHVFAYLLNAESHRKL